MTSRKSNTKDFILKARKIHGDKYCYEDSFYKGSRDKINIRCRIHGVFSQLATNHLKGSGCQKCMSDANSKRNSIGLDIIKKRILKVHGVKYKYNFDGVSKVTDMLTIVCPKHGEFKQNVNSHIKGYGCKKCGDASSGRSRSMSRDEFIERANKVHSRRYKYSDVDFKTARDLINIICEKHGTFKQRVYSHLAGNGCRKCATESDLMKRNGFNKKSFLSISESKAKKPLLYIVEISGEDEVFYKIGITSNSTKSRMSRIGKYTTNILREFSASPSVIFDLEQILHKRYKEYKYKPLIKFDGYTECYSDIPNDLYEYAEKYIILNEINVEH